MSYYVLTIMMLYYFCIKNQASKTEFMQWLDALVAHGVITETQRGDFKSIICTTTITDYYVIADAYITKLKEGTSERTINTLSMKKTALTTVSATWAYTFEIVKVKVWLVVDYKKNKITIYDEEPNPSFLIQLLDKLITTIASNENRCNVGDEILTALHILIQMKRILGDQIAEEFTNRWDIILGLTGLNGKEINDLVEKYSAKQSSDAMRLMVEAINRTVRAGLRSNSDQERVTASRVIVPSKLHDGIQLSYYDEGILNMLSFTTSAFSTVMQCSTKISQEKAERMLKDCIENLKMCTAQAFAAFGEACLATCLFAVIGKKIKPLYQEFIKALNELSLIYNPAADLEEFLNTGKMNETASCLLKLFNYMHEAHAEQKDELHTIIREKAPVDASYTVAVYDSTNINFYVPQKEGHRVFSFDRDDNKMSEQNDELSERAIRNEINKTVTRILDAVRSASHTQIAQEVLFIAGLVRSFTKENDMKKTLKTIEFLCKMCSAVCMGNTTRKVFNVALVSLLQWYIYNAGTPLETMSRLLGLILVHAPKKVFDETNIDGTRSAIFARSESTFFVEIEEHRFKIEFASVKGTSITDSDSKTKMSAEDVMAAVRARMNSLSAYEHGFLAIIIAVLDTIDHKYKEEYLQTLKNVEGLREAKDRITKALTDLTPQEDVFVKVSNLFWTLF